MRNLLFSLTAVACCASLHAGEVTNVLYSTGGTNVPGYNGFFNASNGWDSTNDPDWQGQQGWTGTGSGADAVAVIDFYTPTNPAGNASGTLGVFVDNIPLNTSFVFVERTFAPITSLYGVPFHTNTITASLVAEWSVLSFSNVGLDDTFVIDLRSTNNTSLLSFSMNRSNTSDPLVYDYLVTSVTDTNRAQFETSYGALIRMQVDIATNSTFSGFYSLLDPVTRTPIAATNGQTVFNLNPGVLAGGATALDFQSLRLGWSLADGVNDPGYLGILVNEFTVTSAGRLVPEPGTWAAAALLAVSATIVARRRRRNGSV